MIKKFKVKIHAYGYSTDFDAEALDSVQGIETAILDKIGKNDIKWTPNTIGNTGKCYLTYEEVDDTRSTDSGLIQAKKVSGA